MFSLWAEMTSVFSASDAEQGAAPVNPLLLELQNIIAHKQIEAVFQPIVSLTEGTVLGYEALSRGPQNSSLHRPDSLFQAAAEFNLVWELEYLCRTKALEKAQEVISNNLIFINVDPKIFYDSRFQKGYTKELIAQLSADVGNVIFEITEKTAIEDYTNFRKALDNYKSQGYKIAIDDTGSGYSGLRLLAQSYPHFIKVDMELIRGIDKDNVKQAMLKALYDFSLVTNSQIIAEGIETANELATLINLGIPYGQGYFLRKPSPEFTDIPSDIQQYIKEKYEQRKRQHFQTTLAIPIGELARDDMPFSPTICGGKLLEYFNAQPSLLAVPIVQDGKPVGLMMKSKFLSRLATQYGVAVYMNRPVSLLMDKHPLIVDYHTSLEQVAKSAVAREDDSIYDYIIIIKEGQYYGMTTIKRLLEATTQIEITRAKHANPLTGLPGNVIIERELERVVHAEQAFAVLYFDLDNFKAYNDAYGFENGDRVLVMTAQVIQSSLYELGYTESFLGHIGGDDFMAVVCTDSVTKLCHELIERFDCRIRNFYNETDRNHGYIVSKNRHGAEETFPLISISIAVVTSNNDCCRNPGDIAEAAALLKKKCKMVWHSSFLIDNPA
jgi:diguanylate cyclase (GGDEF)-like protein